MHQERCGGLRWPVRVRVAGRGPLPSPQLTYVIAAVKQKQIWRGVKEVQKFVNKGEKG